MRDRARVRPNRDGTWTATLPSFGFRATPETKTLPTQHDACSWARHTLTRWPGGTGSADLERDSAHDGISTTPAWTPLRPAWWGTPRH